MSQQSNLTSILRRPSLCRRSTNSSTLITDVDELADRLLKFKHSVSFEFEASATRAASFAATSEGRANHSNSLENGINSRLTFPPPPPPPPLQSLLLRKSSEKSWCDRDRVEYEYVDSMQGAGVMQDSPTSALTSSTSPSNSAAVSSASFNHLKLPFSSKSTLASSMPRTSISRESEVKPMRGRRHTIDTVPKTKRASPTRSTTLPCCNNRMPGRRVSTLITADNSVEKDNNQGTSANRMPVPKVRQDSPTSTLASCTSLSNSTAVSSASFDHLKLPLSPESTSASHIFRSGRDSEVKPRRGRRHTIDTVPETKSSSSSESATLSRCSSRMGGQSVRTRVPADYSVGTDKNQGTSNSRMRGNSVVVEQRRSRSSSRSKSKASHFSSTSNVSIGERSLTTALGSIRDRFTTQKSVPLDATQGAKSRYHRSHSRGKKKDKNGIIDKKDQSSSPSNPYMMGSTNMMTSTHHEKTTERNGSSFSTSSEVKFGPDHLSEDMRRKMASLLEHGRVGGNEDEVVTSCDQKVSHSLSRDISWKRSVKSRNSAARISKKVFGQVPEKHSDTRKKSIVVDNMPFQDQCGDFGIYSGQVNEHGRPNGKGAMKYDNGIFFEGLWTDGCQDEKALSQYHRVRSGFTSWKGRGGSVAKGGKTMPWNVRKIDKATEGRVAYVRGLDWVDVNGSGRYTGQVNRDDIPHGRGIMKYDYGLIAEGEWKNGVLIEGPQDRVFESAELPSCVSFNGMSVCGRSVGPFCM